MCIGIAIYAYLYREIDRSIEIYAYIQTHNLKKCALRKAENNFVRGLAYIKQNRKWEFGLFRNYF